MSHSVISRAQSIVLICVVLTTLVLVASRASIGSVQPGACRDLSPGGTPASLSVPASYRLAETGCASDSSPIGYRLP